MFRMVREFQDPVTRANEACLIAGYTPEKIIDELLEARGSLEVLPNGMVKILGAGLLPRVWHLACGGHRDSVVRDFAGHAMTKHALEEAMGSSLVCGQR
jgi:hypothetical protein